MSEPDWDSSSEFNSNTESRPASGSEISGDLTLGESSSAHAAGSLFPPVQYSGRTQLPTSEQPKSEADQELEPTEHSDQSARRRISAKLRVTMTTMTANLTMSPQNRIHTY